MYSRLLTLLPVLATLTLLFTSVHAQVKDEYLYIPIDEVINEDVEFLDVTLWAEGLIEFSAKDTGHIIGKWSQENPEHNKVFGKVIPTRIKENGIQARVYPDAFEGWGNVGDLVGLKLNKDKAGEKSTCYELARMNIFFTDVYGENSYTFYEFFQDDNQEKSDEFIKTYVEDIHFVAQEMVRQGMENQLVEGGRFDGMKLFDAMEKSTEEDLRDFLGYVLIKPLKYMGNHWKISETYATWIVSETPTATSALVNWLVESVNQQQDSRSGSSDCDGESLFLDLEKGTFNNVSPTASMDEVKKKFPCFTGETEEGQSINCNGGVFFLNHDFYFYTGNDYIEVRLGFNGKISQNLLGKTIEEVEEILGKPDLIPVDESEDEWGNMFPDNIQYLYKRKYGALGLAFDPETREVKKIAVHSRKAKDVEICW
ncbi:MAG: hypothetical protein KDE26_10440 [Bacteroidetes bacterium]|nr:hypothetical protein [Bacteroidota bacterium]MCB0843660.1 hypothetical protein [Bacteroidota bacterium]